MNTERALAIMRAHQMWRRGETEKSFAELGHTIEELGQAIDIAIKALEERVETIKWAGF